MDDYTLLRIRPFCAFILKDGKAAAEVLRDNNKKWYVLTLAGKLIRQIPSQDSAEESLHAFRIYRLKHK
jgi:hypothetical protein